MSGELLNEPELDIGYPNFMKTVFFGTPEFSAIILEKLIKNNLKPVLAVTPPDKPVGRGQVLTSPPAKILAKRYNIPVLQPKDLEDSAFKQVLGNIQPDLIVLAAYGPPFLPNWILTFPKYGCLNLHPSLLPKYRGASPIPAAILGGESQTGVTIIRMTEKIDRGGIIAQETLVILPQDTTPSLTAKLAELGARLLIKSIPKWISGEITPRGQGQSPTPYCPQLKKQDGRINWQNSSQYIERQVRAYNPWPGTFTFFKGQILKIIKGYATEKEETKSRLGLVFLTKAEKKLAVQTENGALVIETLQLEGKKPMPGTDFLKGHQDIIGITLE